MDWAEEKYDVSAMRPTRVSTNSATKFTTERKKRLFFPPAVRHQKLLIAQVKMVLRVLFLYIPLPMFWALFDQQVADTFHRHLLPTHWPRLGRSQ